MARLLIAAFLSLLFASSALAQGPEIPELTGRVVDRAGMLTQQGREKVEAAIKGLEAATGGGQMAVLTVKSLNGSDIESFGIKVAEKWKIGQKGKDDGAILIVSREDRKVRLEIGYGWEGFVNDARAGDIIREMGPYFKAGDFAGGMAFAAGSVSEFVTGKRNSPIKKKPQEAQNPAAAALIGLFAFGFILLPIVMIASRNASSGNGTYGRNGRSGGVFFGGGGDSWGGGSSGGGFSGGGGSFGGGGASGSW